MGQTLIDRACGHCGETFKAVLAQVKIGKAKFCSMRCGARSRTGARNSKWRGGRIIGPDGRVMVYAPGHPDARLNSGKYIYEYRLVAGRTLRRHLLPNEIVHHIDGDHTNNAPENLEVMTQSEHMKRHGLPGHQRKAS